MIARGHLINSLYYLHADADESINLFEQTVSVIGSKRSKDVVNLKYTRYLRLGHIGEERINRLIKDDLLDSFSDESYPVCESYL